MNKLRKQGLSATWAVAALLGLLLAVSGCSQPSTGSETGDGAPLDAAADVRCCPDRLPEASLPDLPDTADMADTSDTSVMPDMADTADMEDTSDMSVMPDMPDIADMPDMPDMPDTADMPGTSDIAGTADASDTADTQGPGDLASEETEDLPPELAISGLYVQVSPVCDLAVRIHFKTTLAAHGSVVVGNLADSSSSTVDGPAGAQLEHSIEVLGLKPATAYEFAVTAQAPDGTVAVAPPLQYETGPLPADMPPIAVTVAETGLADPGFILVSMFRWATTMMPGGDWLAVVDRDGIVRWHLPALCEDFHFMANGHVLCERETLFVHEIDLFKGILNTWNATNMGLDCFHHAVYPLPNGNVLVLSTELVEISGYLGADGKEHTYNVVGDLVVEFQPDGTIVETWSMLDMLDPYHVPDAVAFSAPTWNLLYPGAEGGTKDWSHGNSLWHDPSDDSILVSLANQRYVVKFSRADGKLLWRFGPDGDFTLVVGIWPSHQHSVSMMADGILRMFDNGSGKKPKASRAVEYVLAAGGPPPDVGSAWEVWKFTDDQPFYSQVFGDVEVMGNGNVLITDSARLSNPNGGWTDPTNKKFARVIEVTHTSPPQKVHEMVIPDPLVESEYGYWVVKAKPATLF